MFAMRASLVLWLLAGLPACALDRRPLPPAFDEDAALDGGLDAPEDDAPETPGEDTPVEPDAPAEPEAGVDAPLDASLDTPPDTPLDTPPDTPLDVPLDVPSDAPRDAPRDVPLDVPRDAPGCLPAETVCDRLDEDCDGTIDDGVCGGCTAFTVAGTAYLSCPGPISGVQVWSGFCRQQAAGYEVAVFDAAAEQAGVSAALAAISPATHWIGANDFETNGRFVWFDRGAPVFTVSPADAIRSCLGLERTGFYTEYPCEAGFAVLCEARLPPGPCGLEAGSCNGRDEDCDGRVDEGIDCGGAGCSGATFWDTMYWVCRAERDALAARTACAAATGGTLATLTSPSEGSFTLGLTVAEAWVGLSQPTGSPSSNAGWTWFAPGSSFGVPAVRGVAPWAAGEPNDSPSAPENDEENCGTLRDVDGRLNDAACSASLDFVCERPWTY